MRLFLLTSLSILLAHSGLWAQKSDVDAKKKEKTIIIKEKYTSSDDKEAIEEKSGKIVIRTIGDDGVLKQEVIEFKGDEVDIDKMVDSIINSELKVLDIDVEIDQPANIKIMQKGEDDDGQLIWIQDENQEEWIDIKEMMEIV